ncbi:DUF3857 domain-containing protein [Dyadobacter sp. LJ53]|uniref:DUF3857 domain-containing protein n=1 Tax=Dyadobacter chenwenxiniae TaxID=2906456 RepID=UPI001F380279|nr:DUF3857 domain-containing protein [Dyadobacter chenwenxiniae]MCF0053195.1 DUF3857 domain-containing protein [Dyadobacter chenwenxiniae]
MTHLLLQCRLSCVVSWRICVLSALIVLSFNAAAQNDLAPKFGTIEKADLTMQYDLIDSTAEAVYLYDYGEVTFAYDSFRGLVMKKKIWIRIKILKESALSRATVSLPYYEGSKLPDTEKIEDLTGYTYNLINNAIITSSLEKKSIRNEKLAEATWVKKFNLPNVKKGSVIEYAYTQTTPLTIRNTPEPWAFQGSVPTKWSEYKLTIPYFLEYHITIGGYLPLYINESKKVDLLFNNTTFNGTGTSYRLVVRNAPAFLNEPYITTAMDYVSKVSFELFGYRIPGLFGESFAETWDQVDDLLRSASWFGKEMNLKLFDRKTLDPLMSDKLTAVEKMNLAFSHVQKTMKWDKTSSLSTTPTVRSVYENKKGGASEINLILINLMREIGLNSDPVILSTRSNGRIIKDFPSFQGFNYVICLVKIDSTDYLLDATQKYTRVGTIPEDALNGFGRVIPKSKPGYFLDLVPRDMRNELQVIEAEIDPEEGIVKGQYNVSLGGYHALDWRDKYLQEPEQTYVDDFKTNFPEWKIQNLIVSNKSEKLEAAVNVKCEFEAENDASTPGILYFNPMMSVGLQENPLKSPERIYPLDFATNLSTSFLGKYKLPDGYVVAEIPKAEAITLPGNAARFLFQIKQEGNIIQVSSKVMLNKYKFSPEEYSDLREFFERIVKKHSQQLVIKRKENG